MLSWEAGWEALLYRAVWWPVRYEMTFTVSLTYFGFQPESVVYLDMIYYHFQNNTLIIYCVFVQTQRDTAQIPLQKRNLGHLCILQKMTSIHYLGGVTLIWQDEQVVPRTLDT